MLDEFSPVKTAPVWGFFALIALYVAGIILVNKSSASEGVIMLSNQAIPHRTLTGAFSSICNLCMVMLVVLYKKPGFVVALIALLSSFPPLIIRVIHQNFSTIPGFFTNILMIITIIIINKYIIRSAGYQQKIRDQALTDRLTGLPNRFAVSEMMSGLIRKGEPFAVAVINLNSFQSINNAIGQQAGDKALIQVADRWQKLADSGKTGTKDFVACQSGNEFSVIIRDCTSEEQLRQSIECYADALKEKIVVSKVNTAEAVSINPKH